MSRNPFFPERSFRKVNYEVRRIKLIEKPIYIVFDYADFLDVINATADLSRVYIKINDGPQVSLADVIPVITPLLRAVITWDDSENGKEITLLIGHELFRSQKQSVKIVDDVSGIKTALDSINAKLDTVASEDTALSINEKLSQPTILNGVEITIDNSSGTASIVQQLFSTSTPSRYATIINAGTSDVKIGSSTYRATLEPGAKIETTITDLSMIYVEVPAGAVAVLKVFWET